MGKPTQNHLRAFLAKAANVDSKSTPATWFCFMFPELPPTAVFDDRASLPAQQSTNAAPRTRAEKITRNE
ncbi:hypothetical protein V494_07155 [Pseudogymnoascus sp. VKM F-4513 (FW-928)]|nr:hypothetical protein V494_07155 [Pseudogymnoascus sp. VKM F-4513 (FW-928)]